MPSSRNRRSRAGGGFCPLPLMVQSYHDIQRSTLIRADWDVKYAKEALLQTLPFCLICLITAPVFSILMREGVEGLPNGMAVVLKTTVRKDLGVRVPHPPPCRAQSRWPDERKH